MVMLQTVLAFAVVLGVLIIVHELGHYLVARWCGVKVLRFSVGMGKVIWSRRFGADQTEWALSAVPLGGYVKMLDAREDDAGEIAAADAPREFTRQPVGKRIAIVAAGPIANFLLAIAIFAGLFIHGIPEPVARVGVVADSLAYQAGLRAGDVVMAVDGEPILAWSELRWKLLQSAMDDRVVKLDLQRGSHDGVSHIVEARLSPAGGGNADLDAELLSRLGLEFPRPRARLGKILPDGPAARAGLQSGDLIETINGELVADGVALIDTLQASAGQSLVLTGRRGSGSFSVTVVPQAEQAAGKTVGRIKAQVDLAGEMTVLRATPIQALQRAVVKVWETSSMTLTMLGKMLTGEASLKNITGPITIADYAGQTARIGMISFLSFIAFISISLGVMNLLPIPVLDGGHLLYYSLELLTGRPVPQRVGEIAQRAGLGILMVMMAVAMFNDIARLMT